MKKRIISKEQWKWFAGFLICFFIVMLALYFRMTSVRSSALQSDFKRKPQPVSIITPVVADAWRTANFLARIEGGQTIELRSEVGGWVQEKKVEIGSSVEKGDTLLVLKDERKELALIEAKSRLDSARADLKELRRLYNKNISLVEKGIVAKDTLESLNNQIASRRADVNALDASYKRSNWDFEHLVIKAPIQGKIIDVIPDIGQEVLANEVVINLVNSSSKKAIAGVDANWARTLKRDTEVKLTNSINNRLQTSTAVIKGISPNIDRASGTYSVEAQILDQSNNWLPGEIVNMEVPVEKLENVIKVPRTAILSDSNKVFLFTFTEGIAVKMPVSVTWLNDKQGAIPQHSVPEGSKIIIEGHSGLADKQPVRIIN
ncbi:MAG: efflux RND transporter periplasmic adaptor subunit [Candidatus Dadabacteria bacterium]|nr:efflux RND transporter periplasmic adaptor subunit [Candidatus Dadabacteria bacterium]NIS07702.1 efflux RND transporter periplasmic adaptor subunit [Candidatus Dadabacteria bacterium]NIV42281.1 efflux RND transporter periplasmic adaptor subunit [Candidatus Dadabacteria bacterium]NIX14788.1 efflux RND transporter periplasmic adaptor subunit [Candidatus Dadabacteria bacterium]NIY21329.1 efflux RND transporter periplasmic adaptor subunit [Candidatus Dadabacteria bacterium]